MNTLKKVLMVAGGTGGHVFPALVVAQALQEKNVEVQWLGTPTGIEAERIPAAGIPITFIKIKGLRGMGWRRLIRAPFDIIKAIWVAYGLLRSFKPDVVCAMGGFAAGPAGVACLLTGTPLVIQEQNAIAGFTNRILSLWAKRTLLGLPLNTTGGHSELRDGVLIGNPLRPALYHTPVPSERFSGRTGALRVLVLGGSQGAFALNKLIPQAFEKINSDFDIRHQVGPKHLESAQAAYQECSVKAKLVTFIEDMAEAYSWADLVICRSGALTVSELSAVGVASLLIPFPAAIDDHQTYNGLYLANRGAALLLPQASLTPAVLAEHIKRLGNDRKTLLEMAEKARAGAYPRATELVIKELESVHEHK